MYELRVVTHFAAAHQLKMVGEKCENLHGHNWKIEVYVTGERLNAAGVLMDFGVLKDHVRGLMHEIDHKFLNELTDFKDGCPPSSENIARFVAERLQQRLTVPGVRVARVTAWESENACATYFPNGSG
ncbi:MAG: 6-carboxytetrahydropterin synthase QueD [Desulfobacterales bacterium]|jgi:6-pyruvoyltetrahydropterin/6-carboxytetrahydropterin synthase